MAEQTSGAGLEIEHLQPQTLYSTQDLGFTQIVTSRGGKTVYVSGLVAWDADRNVVGKGDLARQTEQILTNLRTALAAAGGTLADIVSMCTYVANYQPGDVTTIRQARASFFPADKPPSSTLIGVQALAHEDFLIEIDAVAVVA